MGTPELDLLVTFAILLVAAELGSLLFRWLRLPRVLGMIAAGVVVGPHVNPWAMTLNIHPERVSDLAFLGGIFLMFSIGLSFDLQNFRRVGGRALMLSIVGSIVSFLAGFAVAVWFGYSVYFALFLALVLTPTTSIIAFRFAHDQKILGLRGVDTTLGSVILDDVTIILLATIVVSVTSRSADNPGAILLGIVLVLALAGALVWLGLKALPRTLHLFERLGGENPTLLAVSLAFLVSVIFTLIDLPPIFGAFWAGSILGSTRFGGEVTTFIRPVTELFSAVFFTAIGMLLNPGAFPAVGLFAAVLVLVAIVARYASGYLSLRMLQIPEIPALACATLLVPKGEVNLVIAQYAGDPEWVQQLQLIATVLVMCTTLAAPLILGLVRIRSRRPAAAGPPLTSPRAPS